jgi:hypothetical protein
MNVEIGTETPIFLFWEYLFRNFSILSLQCMHGIVKKKSVEFFWLRPRIPELNYLLTVYDQSYGNPTNTLICTNFNIATFSDFIFYGHNCDKRFTHTRFKVSQISNTMQVVRHFLPLTYFFRSSK